MGLSRAYFHKDIVDEAHLPTERARAAYRFLRTGSKYYDNFAKTQEGRIKAKASLNLSSYDLFVTKVGMGIECAMFPRLYPTSHFVDTGIMDNYSADDDSNRVVSIGYSWTRKVLSSIRVYGEQRDLPFFLYERHIAQKFFAAQTLARRMGLTADVMARDSQASSGYWDFFF